MTCAVESAIRSAADPARARHGFQNLTDAAAVTDAAHVRHLATLFSGSPAMTELLAKHPDWLHSILAPENLAHPRRRPPARLRAIRGA